MHSTMPLLDALGGLRVVDATHLLCAYLLISSMIVHVYFHTLKKISSGHPRIALNPLDEKIVTEHYLLSLTRELRVKYAR